jgi:hypothetical protein
VKEEKKMEIGYESWRNRGLGIKKFSILLLGGFIDYLVKNSFVFSVAVL